MKGWIGKMKKGDYIKITDDAKYSGQDMRWTEECTGTETLPAGTKLYHFSDSKINKFLSKETCFFLDDDGLGHCYIATLKKEMTVNVFSTEVRFDITPGNCSIQYVGKIEAVHTGKRIKNGVDYWSGKMTWKDEIIIKDNRI